MFRAGTLAVMLAILVESGAQAQSYIQPAPGQVAGPAYVSHDATSGCAPGMPGCNANEDNNGSLLYNDPLLGGKQIAENVFVPSPLTPGWFASVEANAVDAHVKQEMFQSVGVFKGTPFFHLENTDLNWTVAPVFEVGYRMGEGMGEFLFKYQFLTTSGSSTGVDAFGNPATVSSNVNSNVFDLEYAHREFSLGPWCDMKWFLGVRVANVFFETQSNNALGQQSLSNNFFGAGPMVGLNLSKTFVSTGLDIFLRTECAFMYGPSTQNYNTGAATLDQSVHNWVFVPKVEIGVGWTPTWCQQLHLAVGYTYQYWSNLAENSPQAGIGSFPDSRGDLTVQGGFLRGEWNY